MNKDEYVLLSDLKEQGWTKSMIAELLGEPDATKPNAFARSNSKINLKLFLQSRVLEAEQTEAFAILREKADRSRKASQQGIKTKTEKLVAQVDALDIQVPIWPMAELLQRANNDYNVHEMEEALQHGDTSWREATPETEDSFLKRNMVNYLRHKCTRYEEELRMLKWNVGIDQAYLRLNIRICIEIAKAYPELGAECERQAGDKGGRRAVDEVAAAYKQLTDPPQ